MTEGNTYKIWVNNLEKQPVEEEIQAEKYARFLKNREYEEQSKTKQALTQNVNNVLKGISKYKALRGEDATKVRPSNEEKCKSQFLKEKSEILAKLASNPTSILEKMLNDKLKV
jgi:hypothetical protein